MMDSKTRADPASALAGTAPPSLQGNHGTFSNEAPGLVAPSRLNQGDTGIASDRPEAGGELDFDDGDMIDGGRGGNKARTGGTSAAEGADSAALGAPAEILSDYNQPSNRHQGQPDDEEIDLDEAPGGAT